MMMRQLTLTNLDLDQLHSQRALFERRIFALNTEKGYAQDWKMFTAWCDRANCAGFPASPETVSLYLTDLISRGRKVTTAMRAASGIHFTHLTRCATSPVTREVWSLLCGARRLLNEKPRQVLPLAVEDLRSISGLLARDGRPRAIRDRAILVVGFCSALRRSSITDLLLSDVAFQDKGLVLRIRREKQDQEGRGRSIGLPIGEHPETCPVLCLRAWLDQRGLGEGPLFTHTDGSLRRLAPTVVERIVKAGVRRIGLDPARYAGHSLRAGFVTAAAEAGASDLLIAVQTGHSSMEVLRKYFRHRDLFRANACGLLGL